jgi:signal transduction histidine kinase
MHLEKIEAQATVLSDIAYTQSHDVRGEVATILGLAQIFNFNDPGDPTNKVVLEGIAEVTEKLDAIVKATIVKENDLSREDRIQPNKNTLG